ncbi:MAG TPA: sialidase family protein [Kofleriaceae bacterium]
MADAFVVKHAAVERSLVCSGVGQFPVLALAGDVLAIAVRTGGGHYGLDGTLATAWSSDGGRTWSAPIDVAPRGDDVRNPALGVAPDGRWLLAYWKAGVRCYRDGSWQLPPTEPGEHDTFVMASGDRGHTWSAPSAIRSELLAWASPFGRIVVAPDGALVMAAYGPPRGAASRSTFDAIVMRSHDGGASWRDESHVLADASELALCFASPELLVGAVRCGAGESAIVRSRDAGHTWSTPVAATRAGEHPADLCVLARSGRLLMTFGRRNRPLGCGALTSGDVGATWQHEVVLAGDGDGNDVGYPSTVQLPDGALATAIYFARGSGVDEWGELSCQLLRYDETLVVP